MTRKLTFQIDLERILSALDQGAAQGMNLAANLVVVDAKKRAPVRTGLLRASIGVESVHGQFRDGSLEAVVSAGAPYAAFVEFGTGIWGPEGEWIWVEPVEAEALRFPIEGGGYAFSAGHYVPGSPPQPYLQPAVEENIHRIGRVIGDAIELALSRLYGA